MEKGFYAEQIIEDNTVLEKKKQQEAETQEKEEIEKNYNNYINSLVQERLKALPQEKSDEFKKSFLSSIKENFIFKIALEKYGFEHAIIQRKRFNFLHEKLLSKEERSVDNFQKIPQ